MSIEHILNEEGVMDTRPEVTAGPTDEQSSKEKLYPAFLSLQGKTCVIVGGGHVAAQKVRSLVSTSAIIVVISPLLHTELQALLSTGSIYHIPSPYSREHLTGATLVFAATNDPAINLQVAQDAQQQGIWINVADNPDSSDFYVPATIHRKDLTLAVSTAGGSPAFARYVRELLEHAFSEALGQALEMITQARPRILAAPKGQQTQLWESLLALRLETVIATEGYGMARSRFEEWLAQKGLHSGPASERRG